MTERRGGWPGPRKDTLSVRIAPDLNERLRHHAGPERGALNAVVSEALTQYLDRHGDNGAGRASLNRSS